MSEQEFGDLLRGTSPARAMFDFVRGTGAAEAMLTSPGVRRIRSARRSTGWLRRGGRGAACAVDGGGGAEGCGRAPRAVVAEEGPAGVDVDALSPEQFALLQAAVDNRSDLEFNEAARTLGLTEETTEETT